MAVSIGVGGYAHALWTKALVERFETVYAAGLKVLEEKATAGPCECRYLDGRWKYVVGHKPRHICGRS